MHRKTCVGFLSLNSGAAWAFQKWSGQEVGVVRSVAYSITVNVYLIIIFIT